MKVKVDAIFAESFPTKSLYKERPAWEQNQTFYCPQYNSLNNTKGLRVYILVKIFSFYTNYLISKNESFLTLGKGNCTRR